MDAQSGFDDEYDDEDVGGGRRDKGEFSGKGDGRGGDISDPRSKHSATEQRRRSKINDRFQILKELIPQSDQKRDRASFLLEVIEYIRFLQEKVQKYEEPPGWTEENAKLMPWVKVYFRSFWKNSRRDNQGPGDMIMDPSQVIKNGSLPVGFSFSGNDNSTPMALGMLSAASLMEPKNLYAPDRRGADATQSQLLISNSDNLASQSQCQRLRPSCPADFSVASDVSSEQEELAIDEGTISVSSAYSPGLLSSLSQALLDSGIDFSQASVSVQINLGKRATNKRPTMTSTMSVDKDYDDPSNNQEVRDSRVENSGEEAKHASKRHRSDNS